MAAHDADETTPLVNGMTSTMSSSNRQPRAHEKRSVFEKMFNPMVSSRPWRLFEICDLGICPSFVRSRAQATLTAAWIHRFPLLQKASPAELAASLIIRTLDEMPDLENIKLSLVDFCSGAGGPIPTIEKLVNEARKSKGKPPLPFLLCDLHPHIDHWMKHSRESPNLSFIPQKVDATDPPIAVTSLSSANSRSEDGEFASDTKVFRLYCLSFHHFDDTMAKKVLESTMNTADGFAIIELQDRKLGSLCLIFGHVAYMFASTIFYFWKDPIQLFFTYIIPVLPTVVTFDGLVSCLRVRTFREVVKLIKGIEGAEIGEIEAVEDGEGRKLERVKKGSWGFEAGIVQHSWPCGNMNWIVGIKKT
ncbi:hypothetical protein Vi05172_g5455 [Venturia inaequalis]|nr:hypothetical protein Vi05172_g5455 [Venturia inaequalis]